MRHLSANEYKDSWAEREQIAGRCLGQGQGGGRGGSPLTLIPGHFTGKVTLLPLLLGLGLE